MLIGYLGVKLTLPMRSRNVDVLRPVVELINFNLNVIKICGFPAFSMKEGREKTAQESAVAVLLTAIGQCCDVCVFFFF